MANSRMSASADFDSSNLDSATRKAVLNRSGNLFLPVVAGPVPNSSATSSRSTLSSSDTSLWILIYAAATDLTAYGSHVSGMIGKPDDISVSGGRQGWHLH